MEDKHVNNYSGTSNESYKPKKDRSFRIIIITVAAFFIGFGLCVGYYAVTLISITTLSKFFAAFAVIGFLIPLKMYNKWFNFIKYEVVIFNIMGVAPLLSGLFLALNFIFCSGTLTHDYKIEKIYFEGEENYKSVGVILENNFFSGERKIVELSNPDPSEIMSNSHFRVSLGKGLFGFEVVKEKTFIK